MCPRGPKPGQRRPCSWPHSATDARPAPRNLLRRHPRSTWNKNGPPLASHCFAAMRLETPGPAPRSARDRDGPPSSLRADAVRSPRGSRSNLHVPRGTVPPPVGVSCRASPLRRRHPLTSRCASRFHVERVLTSPAPGVPMAGAVRGLTPRRSTWNAGSTFRHFSNQSTRLPRHACGGFATPMRVPVERRSRHQRLLANLMAAFEPHTTWGCSFPVPHGTRHSRPRSNPAGDVRQHNRVMFIHVPRGTRHALHTRTQVRTCATTAA